MIESVIITIVICTTALLAYVCKLLFMSKCNSVDCCGLHVHRNTSEENKDVGSIEIPRI